MSQTLRNIQSARQGNTTGAVSFPAMLEQLKGEIARALPKHLSAERMARIALTAFRMNPKLSEVDPRSVVAAVIQSCQLGLQIGLMGEADDERGAIAGFYAVAVFNDGSRTFHALSKEQVEWVRDHSRGYQMAKKNRKESPWDTHFVPMGLKTAIRRLCNLLPKSPELAMALAMDELNERGKTQNIGMAEAIDGSWAPVIDDESTDAKAKETGAGDQKSGREGGKPPLDLLLTSISQAASVDDLDERYAKAEDAADDGDLEQLLRAYRSRKAALTDTASPVSGIVGVAK